MMLCTRSTWAVLALVWTSAAGVWAQLEFLKDQKPVPGTPVQIRSLETSYDSELGVIRARGEVEMVYGDATVLADEADYHQSTGDVFARGDVTIIKLGELVRCAEAVYNVNTGVIVATDMRGGVGPIFFQTGEVTLPSNDVDVIRMKQTMVTTNDSQAPSWGITARKINIFPNKRVEFQNATMKLAGMPVAYIPYFVQPMEGELGYYATPGYDDAWGAYLLNQYGFMIQDKVLATTHLDLRSERGFAGGIDLQTMKHKGSPYFGRFQAYYANDNNPDLNFTGDPRPAGIDPNRYRLNVQHRVYIPGPDESSLFLDIDINKLSDEMFYLDFFPGEFVKDPKPENLLNLVQEHPRGTLSILGRFQLNDFFTTDTREPEIALDFTRAPIFNSNLFYEGNTSYSVLKERLGSSDRRDILDRIQELNDLGPAATSADLDLLGNLTRKLDESGYNRFDTYHQLVYPINVHDGISLVPRAGVGYSNYDNIRGDGYADASKDRTYAHAGVDASMKFSKDFPNVKNRALGLDQLRHILQPYARYSWVAADDLGTDFPSIDRLALSTKLRPLDVTRFTGIDDLKNWNIMRLGLSNHFLTRRNNGSFPWLSMNTYMDFFLGQDPDFNRHYSNLFNELTWNPLPWLTAGVDAQFPVGGNGQSFTEVNSYLHFQPTRRFEFQLGHFFLQDNPFFEDSNSIRITTYTRLSDTWGFGTAHYFEMQRDLLQLQQYSIHRDFESWTAMFGAQVRDNDTVKDWGFLFSLTLKAFPRLRLPVDFVGQPF